MGYEKQTWYDRPTGGTPINADRLNHIEEGIYQNAKNWDSISPKLTDLFLVKGVTMPSVTVGGSTVGTQKTTVPTVSGYKAIGIVGMNSWHGQLVYQACELDGNTIVVTLRNMSGGSISTTGAVQVLYAKNTDQFSISPVGTVVFLVDGKTPSNLGMKGTWKRMNFGLSLIATKRALNCYGGGTENDQRFVSWDENDAPSQNFYITGRETGSVTCKINMWVRTAQFSISPLSGLIKVDYTESTADANITAKTVSGYKFVCWLCAITVGWVGNAYVQDPLAKSTRSWFVTNRYGESARTMRAFALYIREQFSISPKVLQDITSKFAVQSGWAFRPNQLAAVRIGDLIIVTGCFYRTGAQWNAGAWADSTLLKFPTELAPGGSQLDRNVPITTSVGNDDFCVGMVAKGEINVRTVDHSANFAQNWASSFTLSWVVGKQLDNTNYLLHALKTVGVVIPYANAPA